MNSDASLVAMDASEEVISDDAIPEQILWTRFRREGTVLLRNELIEFYIPKVRRYAALLYSRRIDNSVPYEDYFQYALCGLIECMDRFDHSRGIGFWTYASYRIQGAVLNGLRVATERHQMVASFNQAQTKMNANKQREDSPGNTAFEVFVEEVIAYAYDYMLRNTDVHLEEKAGNLYDSTAMKEVVEEILSCVEKLPERERLVIKLHYFSDKSFDQLSDTLGVTKSRVSQLHQRALKNIRALYHQRERTLDLQL